MHKKSWYKYILIIIVGVVLTIVFHGLTSQNSTVPINANWSFLVNKLSFEAVTIIYFFIAFFVFCHRYYKQQLKLPQKGVLKGLYYGVSIAIIWIWGMIEGVALIGNTYISELYTGLSDGIPIIIMGLLLGVFVTNRNNVKHLRSSFKKNIISFFTVTFLYVAGRYLLYSRDIISSGITARPKETLIWTIGMGITIALSYLILSNKGMDTIDYTIKIFLPNYIVFVMFMPFMFKGVLLSSIKRVVLDTILVSTGCYSGKLLSFRLFKE